MNVKISIELPEKQMEFVERKVREGAFASLSDIVQEYVRDLMLAEHESKDDNDPVWEMRDEIRRRLELPDDQWIRMDENDTMFEDLRAHIKKQIENGR